MVESTVETDDPSVVCKEEWRDAPPRGKSLILGLQDSEIEKSIRILADQRWQVKKL